ncbi:MAG: hypothetical protein WCL14_13755 [Bacteroidota bacterium]
MSTKKETKQFVPKYVLAGRAINEKAAIEKAEMKRVTYIFALALKKNDSTDPDAEGDEEKLSVRLNKSELAAITKETKEKAELLTTLPPAPYAIIQPAMFLHKLNRRLLCSYVADKMPRILAVTGFSTSVPSVPTIQAIYDVLLPLANMNIGDMTFEQKTNMNTYIRQLRTNFTATVMSCASLSNGSLAMFTLTGVANKRKGVKNNDKLAAPTFKMTAKKGAGIIVCRVTEAVPFVEKYIVYYGVGEYDKATWNMKVGSSRIKLSELTKGLRMNFIMAAIGANGEGHWSEMQSTTVPST